MSRAVGLDHHPATLFRELLGPLGRFDVGGEPGWPSDVSDDHSPFEFSLALGASPELRLLFEAPGEDPTLRARLTAARERNAWLERHHGIDLGRLDAIEDLFMPAAPQGRFALWHAVGFAPDRAPEFKVYLNPHVQGPGKAHALVEEMLARLGFEHAFGTVLEHAARRAPDLDDLRYVSLDLPRAGQASSAARVKVYVFHARATPALLEDAARPARNYVPGLVAQFCEAMAGAGPYLSREVATCYSFTASDDKGRRPSAATVHVPIRSYAPNDAAALDRVRGYLDARSLDAPQLARVIDAHAPWPLVMTSGLLSYASVRPEPRGPRVTVYLAAELYRTDRARASSNEPAASPPVPTPEEIVERTERAPITLHPFFQRMGREPVDLSHMWRLFTNIRAGLSLHFPRRLAALVARVNHERIRSLLVRQLDEELGEGKPERAHLVLFDQLLHGLATYRPASVDEIDLAPGRVLDGRLEVPYADSDGDVGVGAAMVIEIFGKQVDCFVADQFRRQTEVAAASLRWLHLHENLEIAHAEESLALARLVPKTAGARTAVHRGAKAVADAGWEFFDLMYQACYRQQGGPSRPPLVEQSSTSLPTPARGSRELIRIRDAREGDGKPGTMTPAEEFDHER